MRLTETKAMAMSLLTSLFLFACGNADRSDGDAGKGGDFYEELSQLKDSEKNASTDAPSLYDSILCATTDSIDYYVAYIMKGNKYLSQQQSDTALMMAKRAQAFAMAQEQSPRKMALQALANSLEAASYHLLRRRDERVVELDSLAFDQIMRSDFKQQAPDIAANLADAYIFVNDIPAAAKWYRKALFLVDSLGLPKRHSITLNMGLAQVYMTLGDYDTVQGLYEQAERLYDMMLPNMQTYFLTNSGSFYYFKGDYEKSLNTFKRLESHLAKHGIDSGMALNTCWIDMADVYLNLGKTDSAAFYVEKSAPFFTANKIDMGIYYANTIRMAIALRRKQYSKIGDILANEGKLDMDNQPIKNIRSRYLTEYYYATGKYKQAFLNEQANKRQNDSIERNRENMRASELTMRLREDTLRLHYEMEIKDRNAAIQRSKVSVWIMLAVLVTLVSFTAAVIMYYRKRRIKTDMDVFLLKLSAIRQRISPHFVFNVLNSRIGGAPKEDADMLVDIAKLIRQNLELSNRPWVTLYEELNFVKKYVSLQKALIGEDFDCKFDTPDADTLEEIKLPSMFVQILVENAIKHGLKCIDGAKRLTISVAFAGCEKVRITVADNGPGFDITRRNANSTKTGLDVISRTMAVLNRRNKRNARMELNISNIEDADGTIRGCQSELTVPLEMKFT